MYKFIQMLVNNFIPDVNWRWIGGNKFIYC